jgi:hypothetical protein
MQIRPWTYLHFTSLWRSPRHWTRSRDGEAPVETSPLLIYVAAVLVVLLAVLEVDAHQIELETLGLLSNNDQTPVALLSP